MAETTQSRYLQYLPAIFLERSLPDQEPYLGQFLLPFEQVLTGIDDLLSAVDQNFAPAMAAEEDFLPWLGTWIALLIDEEWDVDKKRRLLGMAVELYRWRGTVSGLKRYLEIYTGLEPGAIEIQEACWPAGMQIGIASRIGAPLPARLPGLNPCAPGLAVIKHDDYVIDTAAPTDLPPEIDPETEGIEAGHAIQLHYPADRIEAIQLDPGGVDLWYRSDEGKGENGEGSTRRVRHERPAGGDPDQPNISRRNDRSDYCYSTSTPAGSEQATFGGTYLVDRAKAPYRFVVNVHGSPAELDSFVAQRPAAGDFNEAARAKKRAKLMAILDLEKPAHTEYFLKFTPVVPEKSRQWMQIGVHSSIGLDTTIG